MRAVAKEKRKSTFCFLPTQRNDVLPRSARLHEPHRAAARPGRLHDVQPDLDGENGTTRAGGLRARRAPLGTPAAAPAPPPHVPQPPLRAGSSPPHRKYHHHRHQFSSFDQQAASSPGQSLCRTLGAISDSFPVRRSKISNFSCENRSHGEGRRRVKSPRQSQRSCLACHSLTPGIRRKCEALSESLANLKARNLGALAAKAIASDPASSPDATSLHAVDLSRKRAILKQL